MSEAESPPWGRFEVLAEDASYTVKRTGTGPLVFVEVQRGTHFGDDDIERRAGAYGRVVTAG